MWRVVSKKIFLKIVVSSIGTGALHGQFCTKFGVDGGITIVVICDKFFGDQFRSVDSASYKILQNLRSEFALFQAQSPLTGDWRYHTTCDILLMFSCVVIFCGNLY